MPHLKNIARSDIDWRRKGTFHVKSMESNNLRINDFLSGKVSNFPLQRSFWALVLVKFRSSEALVEYDTCFTAHEQSLRSAGGKVILKAFDYVRTVVDGGGLVPDWDGLSIIEYPSVKVFQEFLEKGRFYGALSELTDVYEVHAFKGYWHDPAKKNEYESKMFDPNPRSRDLELNLAAAAELAKEKLKDAQRMKQILGTPRTFIRYMQDDKFSKGRVWQLNLFGFTSPIPGIKFVSIS